MAGFDGETYDHERDHDRLRKQLDDVRLFMFDHEWHALAEIAKATGHPSASVSARLRDLRKSKFGAYIVERKYLHAGIWMYRLVPPGRLL